MRAVEAAKQASLTVATDHDNHAKWCEHDETLALSRCYFSSTVEGVLVQDDESARYSGSTVVNHWSALAGDIDQARASNSSPFISL